jgi:hypothetical protein
MCHASPVATDLRGHALDEAVSREAALLSHLVSRHKAHLHRINMLQQEVIALEGETLELRCARTRDTLQQVGTLQRQVLALEEENLVMRRRQLNLCTEEDYMPAQRGKENLKTDSNSSDNSTRQKSVPTTGMDQLIEARVAEAMTAAKGKMDALVSQKKELQDKLQSQQTFHKALAIQSAKVAAKNDKLAPRNKSLLQDLQKQWAVIQEGTAKIGALTATNTTLLETTQAQEESIKELTAMNYEATAKNGELASKNKNLRETLQAREAVIADQSKTIRTLESQSISLTSKNKSLRDKSQAQKATLEKTNADLLDENAILVSQSRELQSLIKIMNSNFIDLESENETMASTNRELESMHETMASTNLELESKHENLSKKVNVQKAVIADYRARFDKVQTSLVECSAKFEEASYNFATKFVTFYQEIDSLAAGDVTGEAVELQKRVLVACTKFNELYIMFSETSTSPIGQSDGAVSVPARVNTQVGGDTESPKCCGIS